MKKKLKSEIYKDYEINFIKKDNKVYFEITKLNKNGIELNK